MKRKPKANRRFDRTIAMSRAGLAAKDVRNPRKMNGCHAEPFGGTQDKFRAPSRNFKLLRKAGSSGAVYPVRVEGSQNDIAINSEIRAIDSHRP